MYKIEREEFINVYDDETQEYEPTLAHYELMNTEYTDNKKAEDRIRAFAEAWRGDSDVIRIDHHSGMSIVYFKWGYIQYSRTADIVEI